jgi:hypothetical protein
MNLDGPKTNNMLRNFKTIFLIKCRPGFEKMVARINTYKCEVYSQCELAGIDFLFRGVEHNLTQVSIT